MSTEHQSTCTKKEGPASDTRALFTASVDADRLAVLVFTASCARGSELYINTVEVTFR